MEFAPSKPRQRTESIVPMINVVFLLLVFFLMTASIGPPEPFEVLAPEAAGAVEAQGTETLYLGADGDIAFGPARGDAAFVALAGWEGALLVRADARMDASAVAAVLARLSQAGIRDVRLVAVAR